MHNIARPFPSPHRLARLVAWARLMLAWIGAMLFSANPPRPRRHHIRRRYHLMSLDRMAHMAACLILIRARVLARRPPQHRLAVRDFAPAGFARRTRVRHLLRSAIGSKLRALLRHRDLRTRLAILVHALADLDVYARRIATRLERGLTRLFPILAVRPPQDAARSLAAPPAPIVDTS